jgi:hypothetical protein
MRLKEGAIPIINAVPGFKDYYVIYAPEDTATAISILNNYTGAEESNQTRARVGPATAVAQPVIVHTLV